MPLPSYREASKARCFGFARTPKVKEAGFAAERRRGPAHTEPCSADEDDALRLVVRDVFT
jgi:hypothetical protein